MSDRPIAGLRGSGQGILDLGRDREILREIRITNLHHCIWKPDTEKTG